MIKWEYLEVDENPNEPISDIDLDERGEKGWELVSVVSVNDTLRFYFKKPKGNEE